MGVPATCKVNDIPQEPHNGSGGRLGGEQDGQDQCLRPSSAVFSLKLQLWDTQQKASDLLAVIGPTQSPRAIQKLTMHLLGQLGILQQITANQ